MKTLYQSTFEKIKPTQEQSERIREQIIEYSVKPGLKKICNRIHLGRVVAAAIIAVMVLNTTVFADEVKDFFHGFLKNQNTAHGYVEENVFTVSDDHVKIEVLELLSDELTVQMTVKYEALDEVGEKWLNTTGDMGPDALSIQPDFQGDTVKYGTNYGYSCDELKDNRTSVTRYYYLECKNDCWSETIHQGEFTYSLSDGRYMTLLDTSCNVPVYEYQLQAVNDEELSPYYRPTRIRLSRLSYVIYGEQQEAADELIMMRDKYLTSEAEEKEYVNRISLIKKDESRIVSDTFAWGILERNPEDGKDFLIASNSLMNVGEQIWQGKKEAETVDPEEIIGVTLMNQNKYVQYTFVK